MDVLFGCLIIICIKSHQKKKIIKPKIPIFFSVGTQDPLEEIVHVISIAHTFSMVKEHFKWNH